VSITCGIDWAEAHHDVALVDAEGTTVAKRRIDTGLPGFTALMALIAEHTEDPKSVPVAIETDKNLIVAALQAAGLTVHAINPRAAARYRERSAQAGGKSDPGDAIVLANILHGPAPAPPSAPHQRDRPGCQGVRPPASGSHLGPPTDGESPAIGASRVLSRCPQRISYPHAQGCAGNRR